MDDLVAEFIGETTENLAVLDRELVRFEKNPADKETLSSIFRMMHTIKGTCGFLGLPRLEKVAHAGEDVLGKYRDGALLPSAASVTLILQCIDRIRGIIDNIVANGNEGDGDDGAFIAELNEMAAGRLPLEPTAPPPLQGSEGANTSAAAADRPSLSPDGYPVAADFLAEFEQAINLLAPSPPTLAAPTATAPAKCQDADQDVSADAPRANDAPAAKRDDPVREKPASQTIRVSVDVLENLMTLVSEMVLTRNRLLQLTKTAGDTTFKEPIEQLSRTTSELQEGVMKTRMQPVGNAWGKLPRIVRDLANELNKKIVLDMVGEETELDRQVLELIQDPLTHMVRNSADHGLERPEERLAAGKDETGRIRLSAFHEGGHIIMEISDDGRGINTEKVRQKIIERGMATSGEVAVMDDNQVNSYIMRAGFSTAEKVTKVSGRGVGMDVVRSNIEKIGGTIEFKSTYGRGSTFTIKIPLTLAIVSSLIIKCGQERFALPQIAVNEIVRISERSDHRIESLNGAPVLRLRSRLLPLINLSELLQVDSVSPPWRPGSNSFSGYVVICRIGSQVIGVIVDSIADAEEIVVKPLSPILGSMKCFSGNTILGDGQVILILDMNGISAGISQELIQAQAPEEEVNEGISTESILLFRSGAEGIRAVALSLVQRIEYFDMATVEMVQEEIVVQYRGNLLQLTSLEGVGGIKRKGNQRVLVFSDGVAAIGLAIDAIVDIVQDELVLQKPARIGGIIGSGIVAGRAVDVIDPDYYLKRANVVDIQAVAGEAA